MSKFIVGLNKISDVAKYIAEKINKGEVISLDGDVGSGKTTLMQEVMKQLNYQGRVLSPTFSLINEYTIDNVKIIHVDGYRLNNNLSEIIDYLNNENIIFIEWKSKIKNKIDFDKEIIINEKNNKREYILNF